MTAPTIDEMLEWLAEAAENMEPGESPYFAIRAILEHQRLLEAPVERVQLVAIRAFVERVHRRADFIDQHRVPQSGWHSYQEAIADELAAMEKRMVEVTIELTERELEQIKLDAIRAFVERVEALAKERNLGIADDWMHALYDAFHDVRKEANAGTND